MAKKIRFDDYLHVGVIVNNIEESLEKMRKLFDFGDPAIVDFPPANANPTDVQLLYHGKKAEFSARFCFLELAGYEIELIQPVQGDSVWKDFLKEHGEGIHHLKFEVESINETMRFFKEQGIDCPQYGSAVGKNLGKTWAYFDTVPQLGYVVEVLNTIIGEKVEG